MKIDRTARIRRVTYRARNRRGIQRFPVAYGTVRSRLHIEYGRIRNHAAREIAGVIDADAVHEQTTASLGAEHQPRHACSGIDKSEILCANGAVHHQRVDGARRIQRHLDGIPVAGGIILPIRKPFKQLYPVLAVGREQTVFIKSDPADGISLVIGNFRRQNQLFIVRPNFRFHRKNA